MIALINDCGSVILNFRFTTQVSPLLENYGDSRRGEKSKENFT